MGLSAMAIASAGGMKAYAAFALALVAVCAVVLVVQDDQDVVRLSWADLGVPKDTPKASDQDQFLDDLAQTLADQETKQKASDHECLIHKKDYDIRASGTACCDDQLSKDVAKCATPLQGAQPPAWRRAGPPSTCAPQPPSSSATTRGMSSSRSRTNGRPQRRPGLPKRTSSRAWWLPPATPPNSCSPRSPQSPTRKRRPRRLS